MKPMSLWIIFTVAGLGVLLAGCQVTRAGYETAPYTVVRTDGAFELRDYPALLLVETPMANASGGDGGFRRLFRFITGANADKQKIAMTTPVYLSGPPRPPNDGLCDAGNPKAGQRAQAGGPQLGGARAAGRPFCGAALQRRT